MRIGILGGSYDPPHIGHLLVAQDAIEALSLDRLLVIPTAQQPLKAMHATSPVHRLAMARRCFEGVPGIEVDPVEILRGGLSYMVDTVQEVATRFPGAQLFLLVGEDVVPTLPRWQAVDHLLEQISLVVLTRDAGTAESETVQVHGGTTARRLATRRIDVSSTEIRARIREGRSIRGFVSDAVADYIATTGLYLC